MTDHPGTEKLYLEDSYTTSFQASVLSCEEIPDKRFAAVLDKTFFYPESGGQLSDCGSIGGAEITGVWEDESEIVYHGLREKIGPGPVSCQVHWEKRFDHMQQHTGQHVLSRAFIDTGDLQTMSFHMGDDACTIDLEGPTLDRGIIEAAEKLANSIIWEDRTVVVQTVPRGELMGDSLRKSLPDGVTEVRLVEVEGFDTIGCCGTHVKRTGELGMIKVLRYEKAKGMYRVSFKVGRRALLDFQSKHELAMALANRFTTSIEAVGEKVEKLQAESQRHRKDAQRLAKKLVSLEAESLIKTGRAHNDRNYVIHIFRDRNADYLRMLASELKSHEGTVSLLGSERGLVVCAASKDVPVDFSESAVMRAQAVGGTGGGKGGFATVELPKTADVKGFIERVFEDVKNA